MNEPKLGHAAKQAVAFLEQLYEDVGTLIETMDGLLAAKGWHPTEPNRISYDLGNGLDAKHWVLTYLTRLYVPNRDASDTPRAISFSISFIPEAFDEPVCLVTATRFPQPTSCETIWEEWTDSGHVLSSLAKNSGIQRLNDDLLHEDLFPTASAGAAFVVPLCDLDTSDAVMSRVVEPVLAQASDLT